MITEIIAVGDEVVKGHTVNTNATYIARRIEDMGLITKFHQSICDDEEAIKMALEYAMKRSQVIFVVGGLGPTKDDLTKEMVCEAIGKELVFRESIYETIRERFAKRGIEMPDSNKKQACFPEDSYVLDNDHGTAPGCMIEIDEKKIILLPGPPRELIPMLENKVIPLFPVIKDQYVISEDVRIFGVGESTLSEMIPDLLGIFEHHSVATYIGDLEIIIRIKGYGESEEVAKEIVDEARKKICIRLKKNVIGYNDKQLEDCIVELLKERQQSIAVAESCTGGLLAGCLVNSSGVSSVMNEGIVTYSNEAKIKYLGVKSETLRLYGAVSKETAIEMAKGVAKASGASIGIATTGIAGPTGGTKEKPVGTVYVGIAIEGASYAYHLQLGGTRQEIRRNTVKRALYELYQRLQEDNTCNQSSDYV